MQLFQAKIRVSHRTGTLPGECDRIGSEVEELIDKQCPRSDRETAAVTKCDKRDPLEVRNREEKKVKKLAN